MGAYPTVTTYTGISPKDSKSLTNKLIDIEYDVEIDLLTGEAKAASPKMLKLARKLLDSGKAIGGGGAQGEGAYNINYKRYHGVIQGYDSRKVAFGRKTMVTLAKILEKEWKLGEKVAAANVEYGRLLTQWLDRLQAFELGMPDGLTPQGVPGNPDRRMSLIEVIEVQNGPDGKPEWKVSLRGLDDILPEGALDNVLIHEEHHIAKGFFKDQLPDPLSSDPLFDKKSDVPEGTGNWINSKTGDWHYIERYVIFDPPKEVRDAYKKMQDVRQKIADGGGHGEDGVQGQQFAKAVFNELKDKEVVGIEVGWY